MSTIPKVGEIFNQRYELQQILGAGGLGTVFKALQLDCTREVAIKILHKQASDDEDFKKRFLREARALSQIQHEGIVSIYNIGIAETGQAYLVMELINGVSIRQVLLEEGKLPLPRAIAICRQIAMALSLVHAQGIVHRDLKPDNIVLLIDAKEPDTAKLIDFGLARIQQDEKLTRTGVVMGTPGYISPEQCKGVLADQKSDIYALCICFYEMLSGQQAFAGESPMEILGKQINAPAPFLNTGQFGKTTRVLNSIIHKGMAKDPNHRYQSMAELIAALDSIQTDSPVNFSRPESLRGVQLDYKVAILLSLVLVLVSVSVFWVLPKINKQSKADKLGNSVALSQTGKFEIAFARITKLISDHEFQQARSELIEAVKEYDRLRRTGTEIIAADRYLVLRFKHIVAAMPNPDAVPSEKKLAYLMLANEFSSILMAHYWTAVEITIPIASKLVAQIPAETPGLQRQQALFDNLSHKLQYNQKTTKRVDSSDDRFQFFGTTFK